MTRWHETEQAQALLRQIVRERPEPVYLHRYAGVSTRYPRYRGETARQLRALWEAEVDAAMAAGDHDAFAGLHNHEHVDDLIDALLNHRIEVQGGRLAA
jgi:hypothetical protein